MVQKAHMNDETSYETRETMVEIEDSPTSSIAAWALVALDVKSSMVL